MRDIKISVVIPTFNRPSLLTRAIRSVVGQDFDQSSVEVIVIDDFSDHASDITEFAGSQVSVKRMDKNTGPQLARNAGISIATGEWILLLDDDDELVTGALEAALSHIKAVENFTQYPVFFFATTNGHIPAPFMLIGPGDIMNGNLYGDFTPVLNRELFQQNRFSYLNFPEIHGVGCEQLTWLYVTSKILIPSFTFVLAKVNIDADMRLTSYDNFIRNSLKFAKQQDITIAFLEQHGLKDISPYFVEKKTLGAAIYYLVSGEKELCRERLKSLRKPTPISRLLSFLSYLPVVIPRLLFLKYKRTFSR